MAIDFKNQTPKNTLPANGVIFGADDPNATSPSTYTKSALVDPNVVKSISGGTTGLTPAVPTNGDVVISGTLAVSHGGTGVTTKTGTGDVVLSDNPTLVAPVLGQPASGDLTNCTNLPLTTGITGVLDETHGGTGQSSYTIGDLLYASSTTALSKLPDAATGNALISGGVGAPPSWGKVGLTTHVNGTLPVANGGTGVTTLPALQAAVLPSQGGNAGKYLTTDGSTASWGVNPVNYLDDIATLRALAPVAGQVVDVSGYYADGDGGGNQFYGANAPQFTGTIGSITNAATFTGSISGDVLTVSGPVTGTILWGRLVTGSGVAAKTVILEQITGTSGKEGTYRVSISQSVASTAMTEVNFATLTVSGLTGDDKILIGMEIKWSGSPNNIIVYSQTTGSEVGGDGNYAVYALASASTRTMTGYFTDNGGTVIVPTGGDGSSAWLAFYNDTMDVLQFGVKANGLVADNDHIPVQTAFDYISSYGGTLTFPARTIMLAQQVTYRVSAKTVNITGYTTRLTTQGNISAIRCSGGGGTYNTNFRGFVIDHRFNTDAKCGIWMIAASTVTMEQITIFVGSTTGKNYNSDTIWRFNVSGINIAPIAGTVYTIGGVTLTVSAVVLNNTGSTGSPVRSGVIEGFVSSAPPTSGTMLKSSGTGDASISYTGAVNNNYAAVLMEDSTETSFLGCYWAKLDGIWVRPESGVDGYCPYGVYMRGAQNGVIITNSKFSGSVRHIYSTHYPNRLYVPNGNEISGNAVEGPANSTYVTLYSDSIINYQSGGWKINNTRVELIKTLLSLEGTATFIQTPTALINNQGGVINNPNNVQITHYDVAMPVSFKAPATQIDNMSGFSLSQAYSGVFNYGVTKGSISGDVLTVESSAAGGGLHSDWVISGTGIPAGTSIVSQIDTTYYNNYVLTVVSANIPTLPVAGNTYIGSNGFTYTISSVSLTGAPSSRSGTVTVTGLTLPPASSTLVFGTGTVAASNIPYTTVTPGATPIYGGAGTYRLSANCGTGITATNFTILPPIGFSLKPMSVNGQGTSWASATNNIEFSRLDFTTTNPSAGNTSLFQGVFSGPLAGSSYRGTALRNISGLSVSQDISYNLTGTVTFNAERTKNVRFLRLNGGSPITIWGSITNDVLTTGTLATTLSENTSISTSSFVSKIKGPQTGVGPYTYDLYPRYAFVVSGIAVDPPIGAAYTTEFVGTPAATGTLTKISGTGDATIAFSASAVNFLDDAPFSFTVGSITTIPTVGATYRINANSEVYTVAEVYLTGTAPAISGTIKFTAIVNAFVASARVAGTIQFLCSAIPASSGMLTKVLNSSPTGDNGISYSSATANPLTVTEQEMCFNQTNEANGLYTVLLNYEGPIQLSKPIFTTDKSQVGFTIDAGSGQLNYAITVTAAAVTPTAGAIYTIGGVYYTVVAATSTVLQVLGASAPPTVGTLTKISGTGDATLTITNSLDLFEFTVSGIATAPTAGATYQDGALVTYTVRSTSITAHAAWGATGKSYGVVYASAALGTTPPASGTLTKTGGTGDNTIAFSAVTNYDNRITGNVRWVLIKNAT